MVDCGRVRWTVDLGPRCNNRCVHCGLGEARAAIEDVAAQIEAGRGKGAVALTFVGGEPTLHEGLPAWITGARAAGFVGVAVQTNARRMAYAAYAAALVDAGLTDVEVALYGAAAPAHEYHTRAPGSFAQTCAGAANTRGAGVRLAVSLLATRSSWRELPAAAALALRLGAGRLRIAMVRARGAAEEAFDRVVPRVGVAAVRSAPRCWCRR